MFTQLRLSPQTSVAMVLARSLSELEIQFQWQAQLGKSTTLLPFEPEPIPTKPTVFIETIIVGAVSLTILATSTAEETLTSSQRVAMD